MLPMGKGDDFKGMVDLLANKAYTFEPDGSGKMTKGRHPGRYGGSGPNAGRETLIEDIAEADDSLMERYLEGEELSAVRSGRRSGQGRFGQAFPAGLHLLRA